MGFRVMRFQGISNRKSGKTRSLRRIEYLSEKTPLRLCFPLCIATYLQGLYLWALVEGYSANYFPTECVYHDIDVDEKESDLQVTTSALYVYTRYRPRLLSLRNLDRRLLLSSYFSFHYMLEHSFYLSILWSLIYARRVFQLVTDDPLT